MRQAFLLASGGLDPTTVAYQLVSAGVDVTPCESYLCNVTLFHLKK